MPKQCSSGGMLKCSFGMAPTILNILPINQVLAGMPAANIMDFKPFLNIATFGMCTSPMNPAVAMSFGAPVPCTPITATPWFPGKSNILIGNMPALDDGSKCRCEFGGIISVAFAGQVFVEV
jgi:hypothetical protein